MSVYRMIFSVFLIFTALLGCENNHAVQSCQPWPGGKIPFQLTGFSFSEEIQIMQCMVEWEHASGGAIRFIHGNVRGIQTLKIMKYKGNGDSLTILGYNAKAYEAVLLDNTFRPLVLHELGHVIGLEHEHQRPDRDKYITIHFDKIPKGGESDYKKVVPAFYDYRKYPYDRYSITHYPASRIVDGRGQKIGGFRVSKIDGEKIKDIYSKKITRLAERYR